MKRLWIPLAAIIAVALSATYFLTAQWPTPGPVPGSEVTMKLFTEPVPGYWIRQDSAWGVRETPPHRTWPVVPPPAPVSPPPPVASPPAPPVAAAPAPAPAQKPAPKAQAPAKPKTQPQSAPKVQAAPAPAGTFMGFPVHYAPYPGAPGAWGMTRCAGSDIQIWINPKAPQFYTKMHEATHALGCRAGRPASEAVADAGARINGYTGPIGTRPTAADMAAARSLWGK